MVLKKRGLIATHRFFYGLIILNLVAWNPANAADNWSFGITPQLLMGKYNDSTLRDTVFAYGLFANADYLEKANLKLGYNFTTVNGKAGNPDIDEASLFLSGRYVQFSDSLAGKIGLRLDGYDIQDKTDYKSTTPGMGNRPGETVIETLTDDISVIYAQLDYMNFAERFYADVGYARSDYKYGQSTIVTPTPQDNKVQQFTTTAGIAFNNQFDWLQTRIYFIDLEHGNNTDGVTQSTALEFKWLHWFQPNTLLNIHSSFIKLLAGKRLFPVDPDAMTTYSIVDLQTNSVAGGLEWKIGEKNKILLLVGYDQFENLVLDDKYSSMYGFCNLSLNW